MDIVSNYLEKMRNDSVKRKSEEEDEQNLNFEIQTDDLTASHSDDEEKEERMKWRIEDNEYVCYLCGMKGNKFLDHSFGCNHQDAHSYCAIKERYCALNKLSLEAKDEAKVRGYCALKEMKLKYESLEAKDEAKVMSEELSNFFQKLEDTETSVIDYFIQKILK